MSNASSRGEISTLKMFSLSISVGYRWVAVNSCIRQLLMYNKPAPPPFSDFKQEPVPALTSLQLSNVSWAQQGAPSAVLSQEPRHASVVSACPLRGSAGGGSCPQDEGDGPAHISGIWFRQLGEGHARAMGLSSPT